MTTENKCAKCGGLMTDGFMLDRGDYDYKRQQVWIEGAPNPSFWSGIKTSGATAFKVQALRCADCGYLEFYTTEATELGMFS